MASEDQLKVLVVDDVPSNIDLLVNILSPDFKIMAATSGRAALRLAASDSPPDLILLDIMMPDMPGDEVCRQLKLNAETREIPIIFVTARIEAEHEIAGFEMGAVDYIAKPFNAPIVKARVTTQASLIRQRKALAQNHRELEIEKDRSERLLTNVLPVSVAERLKKQEGNIADGFQEASVMFADLQGFSAIARELEPSELVQLLSELFSGFDEIADRHGLEKIKTVGDAYMVAGGVPLPQENHLISIAQAALDMNAFVGAFESRPLGVRIGFNAGPLVAGIIGSKKFSYDLWGDTVNIASRMESHGERGRVQTTESVYRQLSDFFIFEARGEIDVKGQGKMTTYWLIDRK